MNRARDRSSRVDHASAPQADRASSRHRDTTRFDGASSTHAFDRMSVRSPDAAKRSEAFPGDEDALAPGTKLQQGDAGVDAKPAAPTDAGTKADPTLSVSNDSYDDAGGESHKRIGFDVAVPSGQDKKDFGLVNWIKGSMKDGSGKYFKAQMYGKEVDSNYADYVVDSVDEDPLYWSNASSRWNYKTATGGFSATDNPGPALSSEKGAVYAFHMRIGLYRMADVPTKTSGTIPSKAIRTIDWKYSVKVGNDGKFSHPAL